MRANHVIKNRPQCAKSNNKVLRDAYGNAAREREDRSSWCRLLLRFRSQRTGSDMWSTCTTVSIPQKPTTSCHTTTGHPRSHTTAPYHPMGPKRLGYGSCLLRLLWHTRARRRRVGGMMEEAARPRRLLCKSCALRLLASSLGHKGPRRRLPAPLPPARRARRFPMLINSPRSCQTTLWVDSIGPASP